MNAKKAFLGMVGVVSLLVILGLGVTYGGYKMVIKQGDELEKAKLESKVADEKQKLLDQAIKDIAEYKDLELITKAIVPQEKDQAKTVLEIVELAKKSGINIQSVQFPASELGQVTKKSKASSGPSLARGGSSSTSGLTQLTEVEGLKGVYEMTITITADPEQNITYDQLLDYLRRLENNRRTAQVSNISITPNVGNPDYVSFSLNLKSFVKP